MSKNTKTKILLVKSFFLKNQYSLYFLLGFCLVFLFPFTFKYILLAVLSLFGYNKFPDNLVSKKAHNLKVSKDKEIVDSLRQDIIKKQSLVEEPITTEEITPEELSELNENFLFSKKDARDD